MPLPGSLLRCHLLSSQSGVPQLLERTSFRSLNKGSRTLGTQILVEKGMGMESEMGALQVGMSPHLHEQGPLVVST